MPRYRRSIHRLPLWRLKLKGKMNAYNRLARGIARRGGVLLLILATLLSTSAYAGTATPQTLSDAERRKLCAQALEEAEAARELIPALETRLDTARKQLAAAEERATLSDERMALMRETVALLESSLKLARENVAALEKRVVELQEALNEERPKKWRNLAIGLVAGVVLAVLAGRSE
jgi:hypothetical protein